jgi:two-component system, LytTR family, sensor kinase
VKFKQKIYWFCQVLGWSLLILTEYIFYGVESGFNVDLFYLALANILLGILLTHLYRLMIRRWQWERLSFVRLAPRVVASVVFLAFLMTLVNLPIDRELLPQLVSTEPSVFLGYMISWGKTMLAWILSYTAYHYVERTRQAEIEKILLQTSIRDTEAKVLRAQLNPHFVFNALNSIRALVYEDPEKAQRSITQLSGLLRNSLLADRRKTVELREEIKTVEDYLALEKVRYEERLRSHLDIDSRTLFWQVPPMMLQTLVENAIKHGVSKAVGGGFVELRATVQPEGLRVKIRNTGHLGDTGESGGFGLENTTHRLELLYGSEARFRIFQESAGVVCAEMLIPAQPDGVFKKPNQFYENPPH